MFFLFGLYSFLHLSPQIPTTVTKLHVFAVLARNVFLTNCFVLLLVFAFNSNGVIGEESRRFAYGATVLLFSVYMGSLGAQVN